MYKVNLKKYLNRFLILLIGVFIIYSIYIHLEYRHYINQSIDRNYDSLWSISVKGSNLANRLEEFVHLPIEKEEISEVKSELYNNWRIVNGESRSIHSDLFAMSPIHMGDASSDWGLLQYSLFRVDIFISGMTNKFLENHSYAMSSEEKEKMEAVITVFRTISEEKENELGDIEDILQSIKEPMLIIDDNYSNILVRTGRK
ncbi:hypothetical protein DS745_03460 [Anaerobacillus alkaliphilus]|uniref:Uncharacterized protein n=1 Tax=Anaerobacillus alkaliphilus TaxID=1548597 RepID=A0A4Q0VXP0_9BACI|nr:hypothetical protein [Anaerobacillus alkaliphilus]RXJ04454.1 hypothetical protein DS745_03460 [Anaerobacillus alkaliphilus]